MTRAGPARSAGAIAAALALGVLTDFIANGVLKIRFAVIYAPVYVGLASILVTRLYNTPWEKLVKPVAGLFLVGAFGFHLAAVGHEHVLNYTMALASKSPLTFKSPTFPQMLIVVSRKVEDAVA